MNCKVSVIIPVYNCIKYLEKAVKSVISQTEFEIIELILVDDGSTDGSEKLCDRYAEMYDNISVIHQKNSGVSVARNNGIKAAKGEYIAFLDSDDEYKPSFILEMLKSADADLVCCDYFISSVDERNVGLYFKAGKYSKDEFDLDFFKCTVHSCFYSCWDKLYKKDIIKKNHVSFPAGVKYAEDMVFVFEYLKYCESFEFINEPLYHYNVNPDNATYVVKNGFDVYYFIYEYQTRYFEDAFFKDDILNEITENFVYFTTNSVNSEITYGSIPAGYKYVKRVLASDFYDLYLKADYSEFKCFYDKVFFTLLKKRMAFAVVLWRKLFDLRSKLLHD